MEDVKQPEPILQIRIKEKSFDENIIIKDLDLNIQKGEFISILGKSGIGKTTLFKIIAGVDSSYNGEIIFENNKVNIPNNSITLMLQGHILLPWLTVKDNIKFINNDISDIEIESYLNKVGIANKNNEWPNKLSGGEKTRVGLSIALINKSKVLLLDEPFSDIDIVVKADIIKLLNDIRNINNTTILMITHNIEDAISFSDRILVFANNPFTVALDTKVTLQNRKETRELLIHTLLTS